MTQAENPRGATAFASIETDPPNPEREFVDLWKLYIACLIAKEIQSYGIDNKPARLLTSALHAEKLIDEGGDLQSLLTRAFRYVRSFRPGSVEAAEGTVSEEGFSGKILFREPDNTQKLLGCVSVSELLRLANQSLIENNGFRIWVLLDRLDIAFQENSELEQNALRALFRAYLDIINLERIRLKIFLRSDIWRRIVEGGFRESSHITRTITLSWDAVSLLNLLVRRAIANKNLCTYYGVNPEEVLASAESQRKFFYWMFPEQVDPGSRQTDTLNWMLTRTVDGKKKHAPRELIHFLNSLRERQINRLELGQDLELDHRVLFARAAFKEALPEVSETRLSQTLYAEYPQWRDAIEALRGSKTEFTAIVLANIWDIDLESTQRTLDSLVDIGFFELRRNKKGETSYWAPFLYRDALELTQGAAD